MRIFTYATWGTGDGVMPLIVVGRSLEKIREAAIAEIRVQELGPCDECGERAARGQERPDDECECSCHEEVAEYAKRREEVLPAVGRIESWDGKEELTVEYFDGNPGFLTLASAELPDESIKTEEI